MGVRVLAEAGQAWSDQAVAGGLGVASGLLTSVIWLVALRRVRPRLELSPHLVRDPAAKVTRIKVVNRSRRAVVEVSYEMAVICQQRTRGGMANMRRVVTSRNPPPLYIPGRRRGSDNNTLRIMFPDDLSTRLENDDGIYIRFRIYGKDEVSGLGRAFQSTYHEPRADFRNGKWAVGQTFEVVELATTK
ncbi:hypothetical protein GCM10010124_38690 [Pilimelia terevasa]|uniref:Uncharacterized protein n=1 Tax=Pilimelia terevasa TaxID=53372 RepID=A0A8J3BU53_9ACTN|nr:hypothetical protein [Pilimelia terevasa]GGK42158.1 hypothetical protein GCM10010124_38690 [Pilimelia terevasa]